MYYCAFFPVNFVLKIYHMEPARQIEEYVPQRIPTISGNANSRIEVTPRMYKSNTIMNVVIEVLILLESVCVRDLFATSARLSFVCFLTP